MARSGSPARHTRSSVIFLTSPGALPISEQPQLPARITDDLVHDPLRPPVSPDRALHRARRCVHRQPIALAQLVDAEQVRAVRYGKNAMDVVRFRNGSQPAHRFIRRTALRLGDDLALRNAL